MMTKTFRSATVLALWFALCLLPTACKDGKENNSATTWCILLDMTGVRESTDTRQHYVQHLKAVFEKIAPGDAVATALITEFSAQEPELLLRYQFPVFKATTDNDLYIKGEKQQFEARHKRIKDSMIQKAADTILNSSRIASKTDIISACHLAAGLFKEFPSSFRKLIILSDMEEYDGTYDFIKEKLTKKRIEEIIGQEKKSSRNIPDLAGVHVYVAGAASKQTDRFYNIRNFWQQYFSKCGASLREENYGGALLGL